jgi:hypothetical protein
MDAESTLMARRAIEALRSGVPNRDAVGQLPVFQGDVTQKFTELVLEMQESMASGEESARSMTFSGAFGAGKSHLLEYLRHKALEHGCVCSHLVISKETPLFDSLKLLRAAAETAKLPGIAGRAVPEILFSKKFDSPKWAFLYQWAHQQPGLGDRIAPILKVLDEPLKGVDEFLDKVAWEWSGYPMKVSDIRNALKDIDQHKAYSVKTISQRVLGDCLWRLLPRLFYAAGYNGWVVLIDEVELTLRYSKLQRAKSYAQIAKLSGATKDSGTCGFLPVFSVTDDFWVHAEENLRDSEIPEWLRDRGKNGDVELARSAEAGMKLLRRPRALRPPRDEELGELKERVRRLHSQAFGWDAPQAREREVLSSRSVREHVKSWIAEWDMMLLYPDYRTSIVVDEVTQDYSEDEDLSREISAEDMVD